MKSSVLPDHKPWKNEERYNSVCFALFSFHLSDRLIVNIYASSLTNATPTFHPFLLLPCLPFLPTSSSLSFLFLPGALSEAGYVERKDLYAAAVCLSPAFTFFRFLPSPTLFASKGGIVCKITVPTVSLSVPRKWRDTSLVKFYTYRGCDHMDIIQDAVPISRILDIVAPATVEEMDYENSLNPPDNF
ncbi:hypothetical protein BLNAU_6319 [Blattamonas nauphoetae]|uniref:Uncharacterized protein n=1 Tax=Blattamonas nauphoetae TaxID=2049346 RepID=A0ABQ9Y505_9EUKA|nr:hypothetical protein BLNAU_6319 [Blattamonas nauphoetae]